MLLSVSSAVLGFDCVWTSHLGISDREGCFMTQVQSQRQAPAQQGAGGPLGEHAETAAHQAQSEQHPICLACCVPGVLHLSAVVLTGSHVSVLPWRLTVSWEACTQDTLQQDTATCFGPAATRVRVHRGVLVC